MPDQLLFVCHANLCRSPMAEFIARRLLADQGILVSSAGTDAVDGAPMHPHAAAVVAAAGQDPAGFRTRALRPEQLAAATLVLTATRRQRAYCAALVPAALHRTFTLRQFGRLAAAAEPPRQPAGRPLPAAIEATVRARGRLQASPDADDLVDPMGGTPRHFRRCADEITGSLAPIVALIAAAGSVPASGPRAART